MIRPAASSLPPAVKFDVFSCEITSSHPEQSVGQSGTADLTHRRLPARIARLRRETDVVRRSAFRTVPTRGYTVAPIILKIVQY